MPTKNFSIGDALNFGWNIFKGNAVFFILLLVIIWAIYFSLGVISAVVEEVPIASLIVDFSSWALMLLIGIGLIKIALMFCDNQKSKLGDLFSGAPLFLQYAIASILYFLIVAGGLILLIVPGIIWAIKFMFYGYLIVDKKLDALAALKKSAAITEGARWNLFLFGFLLMVINVLGAIALFVGLFVTFPITLLANAFVYRKLLSQTEIG